MGFGHHESLAGFDLSGFVSDKPPHGGALGIIPSFTCTCIYVYPWSFVHSLTKALI